ncbi:phycobilisome rod-core linker polypeptide [Adonisia turfae]|uniref:Phycobilisome rod-core linker polypeptide CpcG n=1 Tax=Adonisia turfae CCMR0081 TaxID=2292702 RepID=A0A6M0RLL5_9CYAN|nr:phycobilisome rod-core linker polypeptide [Adonisia turfae]NEZ56653.1 phycobilisome rod-core linker polypeptide CpcG [Adonisia turfae CCMR0081]
MTIPLLAYSPSCPNQRVDPLGAPDDETIIYSTDDLFSPTEMGALIDAAYRQIFFHAFRWDREIALESQLRNRQITVRDFIRGLLLSNTFIDSFYSKNSNYRFVKHCIERVLGRRVYSEAEQIAWSAVVMSKGLQGFIAELLNSHEYLENFGENVVPYHRRRVLPSRTIGEVPFNIASPRYDAYHRDQLGFPQPIWQEAVRTFRSYELQPKVGDPALFLDMAKGFTSQACQPSITSTDSIDIDATVPYRDNNDITSSPSYRW